jgi:hypothetical protein
MEENKAENRSDVNGPGKTWQHMLTGLLIAFAIYLFFNRVIRATRGEKFRLSRGLCQASDCSVARLSRKNRKSQQN